MASSAISAVMKDVLAKCYGGNLCTIFLANPYLIPLVFDNILLSVLIQCYPSSIMDVLHISCSSAPWLGSEDKSSSYDLPDVKVRAIDQHEDSVYGVAWSPADAWIYCSLSFDERVILNHVPSTEKYKILL